MSWPAGKKHSEEHCRKISEAMKGRKLSDQHRRKISIAHFGKILSEEHRKNIAKGNAGKRHTEVWKQNISKGNTGKVRSRKQRLRMSMISKGRKHSEETRRKMAENGARLVKNPFKNPKKHYCGIHKRIQKKFGIANKCELCGETKLQRYHWSNKDHKYKSLNREDWQMACGKCHKKYDKEAVWQMKRYISTF